MRCSGSTVWRPALFAGLAVTAITVSSDVTAAGLEITPITVLMRDRSATVTLSNASAAPIMAQVRVYRWTQGNDGNELTPTDELVASPPQVRIAGKDESAMAETAMTGRPAAQLPENKQLVRLVQTGVPRSARELCREESYRIKINELPAPPAKGASAAAVNFVTEFSVPVFILSGACDGGSPSQKPAIAPVMAWKLERRGGDVNLIASNGGQMHARLSAVSFTDKAGKRTELAPGLLGYVLPGSAMSFVVSHSPELFGDGGSIEVTVNDTKAVQPVAVAAAAE